MSSKKDLLSEIISEIDKNGSSSDESEEKVNSIQITKELQENVVKYVKYDDLIRKKQQELADLKDQKKPCEEYILKYLDQINLNVIDITEGKLRVNKSETKKQLSQDIIKGAIAEKVADPLIVEEILKLMETKRPLNTHTNLKRTHARTPKTGKKKKE